MKIGSFDNGYCFLFVFVVIVEFIHLVSSLSCYKCSSINGSHPECEDLFQGDISGTPSFLNTPCLTHLRGRQGVFPATHCIKLVAFAAGSQSVQYTYRTCGRDEAGNNRIARASHCGFVKLDWIDSHRRFRGCLHICDKDACNSGNNLKHFSWKLIVPSILFLYFRSVAL